MPKTFLFSPEPGSCIYGTRRALRIVEGILGRSGLKWKSQLE